MANVAGLNSSVDLYNISVIRQFGHMHIEAYVKRVSATKIISIIHSFRTIIIRSLYNQPLIKCFYERTLVALNENVVL
jgi:hypothetical protein